MSNIYIQEPPTNGKVSANVYKFDAFIPLLYVQHYSRIT